MTIFHAGDNRTEETNTIKNAVLKQEREDSVETNYQAAESGDENSWMDGCTYGCNFPDCKFESQSQNKVVKHVELVHNKKELRTKILEGDYMTVRNSMPCLQCGIGGIRWARRPITEHLLSSCIEKMTPKDYFNKYKETIMERHKT